MIQYVLQGLSLLIVGLGQPALWSFMAPLAAGAGFAIHWFGLRGFSVKQTLTISFGWFFFVQLIQTSWMVSLEYQGLYIIALYFSVSLALALQFTLLTYFVCHKISLKAYELIGVASLWTLLEWSRLHVLCGYAFNFVGVSLSVNLQSLQVASIAGIFGMSFWVIITNLFVYRALKKFSKRNVTVALVLALCPYLYGLGHLKWNEGAQSQQEADEITALLVQTQISPAQKYRFKGKEECFTPPLEQWRNIMQELASKFKSHELIVLPEAAVPYGLDTYIYSQRDVDKMIHEFFGKLPVGVVPRRAPYHFNSSVSNAYILQSLSSLLQATIVVGLDYESTDGQFYNSAFCFDPKELSLSRYDKQILLPLAEYMPFSLFRCLSKFYGIEDFFSKGQGPRIFTENLRLTPSICYEELFPSLMRKARTKGARLFVNLTNDGYYPSTTLPMQHFTQGLIRAVENGIPLIRACNTGVTAAVDRFGRIVALLEGEGGEIEHVRGCLSVKVSRQVHRTLYSFWGEGPLGVFCLFSLGFWAHRGLSQRNRVSQISLMKK